MIIRTKQQLSEFLAELEEQSEVVVDTETTGLKVWSEDRLCGIGFAFTDGRSFYLPYRHKEFAPGMDLLAMLADPEYNLPLESLELVWEALAKVPRLIGHNIKFDLAALYQDGYRSPVDQEIEDTLPGARIYFPEKTPDMSLEGITKRVLGKDLSKWKQSFKDYLEDRKIKNHYDRAEIPIIAEYCEKDCLYTYEARTAFVKHAEETDQIRTYDMERDLMRVLWEIEEQGLMLDKEYISFAIQECRRATAELMEMMEEYTGPDFNPWSNQQISSVAAGLGIPIRSRTPTGQPQWTDAVLQNTDHPLAKLILDWRAVDKMVSTFFQPYLDFGSDHVHPSFKSWGAVTGRFSCVIGSTPIECPRDLEKYPLGIPIKELKPGQWIYSYTRDRKLCLRRVRDVWIAGKKKTIKIKLSGNLREDQTLEITPDHLVRIDSGAWIYAGDLKVGQRIISMPRRSFNEDYSHLKGKVERFGREVKYAAKNIEHRWIYTEINQIANLSTKMIVHHKDHKAKNNSPENLEALLIRDHISHHKKGISTGAQRKKRSWDAVNNLGVAHFRDAKYYSVVSIEEGDIQEVWDLSVEPREDQEDTQCFFASGVLVHNCSDPNLQQVSRPVDWKDEGFTLPWFDIQVRRMFIAPQGYRLVLMDYSQMEMVGFSDYLNDEKLRARLNAGQVDFHSLVACLIFNTTEDDPEFKKKRKFSKSISLGLVYGMGIDKLANSLGVSEDEAKHYKQIYFRQFPKAPDFINKVYRRVEEVGYVFNQFGRRYELEVDYAYKGVNYLVQGTCADLIKMAMIRIRKMLLDRGFKSRIAFQMHDEFGFYVKEEEWFDVVPLLQAEMEKQVLKTKLFVDISVADPSWGDKSSVCKKCYQVHDSKECGEIFIEPEPSTSKDFIDQTTGAKLDAYEPSKTKRKRDRARR